MGSIQKKAHYDKLHARYGAKYNVPGKFVAEIRSMALSSKLTKGEILKKLQEVYDGREQEMLRMKQRQLDIIKAIDFLTKATPEEFADITERNPKHE